jgi:hypothetical protein
MGNKFILLSLFFFNIVLVKLTIQVDFVSVLN